LAVFSIGNFYWITVFPLWNLPYPSHIWMRWSVTPAVFIVLILFSWVDRALRFYGSNDQGIKRQNRLICWVMATILLQYIVLWIVGHSYLQRWWG
jgi:hypothetical protein